jgi:hypothetical protein
VAASAGPPYQVTFSVEIDDFVAASRLLRRQPITTGILFGLSAIGIGAATVLITGAMAAGVLAVIAGAVGVVVFGSGVLDRRMAAHETRSFLGMPVTMEIGDEGVETTSATGSSSLPWTALTHVVADERVIVLMRDRVSMAWLPASVFASPVDRHAALAFMRGRIEAGRAQAAT